jgi:ribosome-binding factor A
MNKKIGRLEHMISFHTGNILVNIFPDIFSSVVKTEFSKDRRSINIFISIFNDNGNKDEDFRKIKDKAGKIKFMLAHKIAFKKMPNIFFVLDETMEYSQKINSIIRDINKGAL